MIEVQLPVLYIVVPCYNEQEVLPITAPLFLRKILQLVEKGDISSKSRILFVNDGSKDDTFSIIKELSKQEYFEGVSLSRNKGHQNALLCGLMTAKLRCDITISIDCDGQDDINAMDKFIREYKKGSDIVYGVRSSRKTDTFFKRFTAEFFYKLMKVFGAEVVFNHADYRLMSKKALNGLAQYKEVNLFLRGLCMLVGFKYSLVEYERSERLAGESHYPLSKMLALALNGITSLSDRPIKLITGLGGIIAFLSLIAAVWSVFQYFFGYTVSGWASMATALFFMSGVQLFCLGIIGEYVGKIYLEAKARPPYIVDETTFCD